MLLSTNFIWSILEYFVPFLMLGAVVMVCKKDSKSNMTRIFAQSCQGRWIFFLSLELEQACFIIKPLEYKTFHLGEIQTIVFCHFFNAFLRDQLPTSRSTLLFQKACFHSLYFKKNLLFTSFHLPCQRNKRTLSLKV